MKRKIIIEVFVWVLFAIASLVVWYPVFSQIDYKFLPFSLIHTFLFIMLFRWYVRYDDVIFFQTLTYKVIFMFALFLLGGIFFVEGLEIIRLLDENSLNVITVNEKHDMGMKGQYDFFMYLTNLVSFNTFGMSGVAIMIVLKIVYRAIGFNSEKNKRYLENA